MGTTIVLLLIAVVVGGFAYYALIGLARRARIETPHDLPPGRRRRFWLRFLPLVALSLGITAVAAWSFTSGRPAIGIAVLVVFFVLPDLALLPVRIRRSRKRATAARARRTGRASQ
jgi:hypothetical protein